MGPADTVLLYPVRHLYDVLPNPYSGILSLVGRQARRVACAPPERHRQERLARALAPCPDCQLVPPLPALPERQRLRAYPMDEKGLAPSPRGVTRTFGPDITQDFLDRNNLQLLIRSHQVQENGYGVMHNGKCITVFSAPNYMGRVGNLGAICKMQFDDNGDLIDTEFTKFSSVQPIDEASLNNTDPIDDKVPDEKA